MYLDVKQSLKISISSEILKLRQKLRGPFLETKKKVDVSNEFSSLLKKFEKSFTTPMARTILASEQSTVKIDKTLNQKFCQAKITNLFPSKKTKAVKGRISI